MVNPRKVYVIDNGLVRACSRKITPDWGHLLENFVFLELRRHGADIAYYRTQKGREVDFCITAADGTPRLIQVAAEMGDPNTIRREMTALDEAMAECGHAEATLLTFATEDHLKTASGRIHVRPAWKWALNI